MNLALAIFQALRKNPFRNLVIDFSRAEPIALNRLFMLSLSLLLSLRLKEVKDSRVGLALPPGIAGIIGTLGVIFAGKIPVNLNLTVGQSSMLSSMRKANINLVITAEKVRTKFPDFPWPDSWIDLAEFINDSKSRKITLFRTLCALFFFPRFAFRRFGLNQIPNNREEAVLLFTSGSSSQPKGVVLSDENLLSNCRQIRDLGLFDEKMVILGNLPLFHSFGLTVGTLFPILHGLRIVSAPSPLDYKNSLRAIREGKVEVLLGTPTFLKGYVRKGKPNDFESIKYVVAGAEKSPIELMKLWEDQFGCEYLEGYGLTETSPGLSFNLPGNGKKEGSVGRLMKGVECRTTNPENGSILEDGKTGILCFRGPNVFRGYLDDEEKNKEAFSEDGWFITGDLGRIDAKGFLFIEGRLSRFSKIGGEMVPHESIEDRIHEIMEVDIAIDRFCAVVGIDDKAKGEKLVLLSSIPLEKKDLQEKLTKGGMPNLWIPKQIVQIEEIPFLGTGKLDLGNLVKLAKAENERI